MPERDPDDRAAAIADTIASTAGAADIGADATVAAGSQPPSQRAATRPGSLAAAAAGGAPRPVELPRVDPGVYVTDEEIARGGMGRIVAAVDRRLGRPVALKELLAAGPEAAARFRREALITARLQHPAIVPVYEAGLWPSGEPFYAMKLVAGRPLDRVIAGCRTLEERLALLPAVAAVCEAIAYAHGQRIVHRDLKPANVLVGDYGEIVVIDWGLAKDLDADDSLGSDVGATRRARAIARAATDPAGSAPPPGDDGGDRTGRNPAGTLTVAGAVMGTPAYMPPEQATGDAVDERADVFSLGAMLYHVLAGAPPYAARSATDVIAHAIAGKVVPLRQRAPRAPADLVAIVDRAMAHEPAARYRTARELAEELRRFQTGQLVGAHRYTAWERVRRFVRRHRAAVTIAAIAAVGFAAGGALAVGRIVAERDRAEAARQDAERRRDAAEKLVDFMVTDMQARLDAVGQLALMTGLGANVRDYYADLSDLPGGMRPDDTERMTRALAILGAAERQSGDLDAALASFEDARARLRALIDAAPGDPATPRRTGALAHATALIGSIHQARGRIDDALATYREAVVLYERARDAAPADRELLLGAADAHDRVGDLQRNRGFPDEAILDYREGRTLREAALDRDPGDIDADYALSTSDMKLGSAEQHRGATRVAIEFYRAAAARRERLAAAHPARVGFQHGLSFIRGTLADLLREAGQLDEARAAYQQALATLDALVRKDPDNTEWRRDRGNALANLGFVAYDLGDARGALDAYAASLANHAVLTARDPANASWQIDVSRTHTRAGDAHLFAGDIAAALASYREARAIRAALVARDGKNPPWRRSLAWSEHKIAGALAVRGDAAGALAAARAAHALRDALVAEAPGAAALRNELALSEAMLGRLLAATGARADAAAHLDRAVERARALVDADRANLEWQEALAGALLDRAELRLGGGRADLAGAATDAGDALAIAEPVTTAMPDHAVWQVVRARAHDVATRVGGRGAAVPPRTPAEHAAEARRILDGLDAAGRLGFEHRALLRDARARAPAAR